MERLMNLFSTILITSGHLERRISRIDNRCWTMSVKHLQDSDRINDFFARIKLVNYVYSILFELHRDFFPSELINVRGSMNAFLATIHNYLHLSDDFTFDSNKLQNIIKQRKKRYNTVEIVENSPLNYISTNVYKKTTFRETKTTKKNINYYVSPDITEENILRTLDSLMENVMSGGTFDDQLKCLMNKFSEFEIPRLRQVTINSNGIFFIDMHMKLHKPFIYLYQTACLCMNQKALAKKNRETIGHAVKNFCREINGEALLPEVGNNDVDMVEQINELTPEELEIIDAFENFEMEQFLKSEIYNHDEAVAAKILKFLNDNEEIRIAEKNLNDSKRKMRKMRRMEEKKRSEKGEKEEKREEEKGSEEEEGKERKEEEERKVKKKEGGEDPKKILPMVRKI
uniref:Uncharacterized protein n=1 Tax=Strongyloides venezuelensis TaxID=75913 RepID=A0A0K0G389_STRVS